MLRQLAVTFLALAMVVACNKSDEPYQGKYLDVSFEERLIFGTKDSLSKASFYAVSNVQVGPNGKIYVVAAAQKRIKVFSREGDFLYQFGGSGRGPGEFIRIEGSALEDNSFYVWDQDLQRIQTFNISGELTATQTLEGVAAPMKFYFLGGQPLLLYSHFNGSVKESTLAHIYNNNFSDKGKSFIPIKSVDKGIEEVNLHLMSGPGDVHVLGKREFYYIPKVFGENIYKYIKTDSNTWRQSVYKVMNRQSPFTFTDERTVRKPDVTISSALRNEKVTFIKHNQSRGLFEYRDLLFHFSLCDIEDKRVFGAAIYDKQFNPVGYVPIESMPITNKGNNFLNWYVKDVDELGNFYIMERYDGGTRIRVLHLDYQELKPYL